MKPSGTAFEVFRAFLILGVSSFGGPVAHLGYFRRSFVERRQWLSEADYASLVALCQFLPGPASSQTGFCIGLHRAGWLGGLAAWVAFTLPSAVLMFAIAASAKWFESDWLARHILHGLQLAAIAVVAQAVWVMARSLCPDTPRRLLAALAFLIVILAPGTAGQILVLLLGAGIGRFLLLDHGAAPSQSAFAFISRYAALACLTAFLVLLAVSLIGLPPGGPALFGAFYRTGALVFGGGHVVLPLLQDAVVKPGWVPPHLFLAGYGAAQAMPGPLFTVAAFLGAISSNAGGFGGAMIALIGIFLPGLLLVAGILPFWAQIRQNSALAASLAGINAAVVGLLGYALFSLITLGTVENLVDAAIVVVALLTLIRYKAAPIIVVGSCSVAAIIF